MIDLLYVQESGRPPSLEVHSPGTSELLLSAAAKVLFHARCSPEGFRRLRLGGPDIVPCSLLRGGKEEGMGTLQRREASLILIEISSGGQDILFTAPADQLFRNPPVRACEVNNPACPLKGMYRYANIDFGAWQELAAVAGVPPVELEDGTTAVDISRIIQVVRERFSQEES